jgi:Na+/alanine symporter
VLAQWRERDDSFQLATGGPVIGLHAGLSRRRLGQILAASLLLVLVAISTLQSGPDSAHDELMEPDVLSLISLGEL